MACAVLALPFLMCWGCVMGLVQLIVSLLWASYKTLEDNYHD